MNDVMIQDYPINIKRTSRSRIKEVDFDNIAFGEVCADHMFIADYYDGEWHDAEILPYGKISFVPAISALHYGQSIFEGMKAYRYADDSPVLFRPLANHKRFNLSAQRMAMPDVPEAIFIGALNQLVSMDRDWIPTVDGGSLYIRPFMFATEEYVGIRPAEHFRFIVFTSPVSKYYTKPVKVLVSDYYVRAFRGGTGTAKAVGNYGASMLPMMEARKNGYDQMLWLDGRNYDTIQEIGTMNVFFVIGDTVVTPTLANEDILDGVTRDSCLQLLRDNDYTVEEREVTMSELYKAYQAGQLKEAFGTGTAATVAPITTIGYNGEDLHLIAGEPGTVAHWLKVTLNGIKRGTIPDKYGWIWRVS
jgi:branched-chain amino acid aminotransferase